MGYALLRFMPEWVHRSVSGDHRTHRPRRESQRLKTKGELLAALNKEGFIVVTTRNKTKTRRRTTTERRWGHDNIIRSTVCDSFLGVRNIARDPRLGEIAQTSPGQDGEVYHHCNDRTEAVTTWLRERGSGPIAWCGCMSCGPRTRP